MSRYLEAKNNACYILSAQVMSLPRLLLTKNHNLEEFRRSISICQRAINFLIFMSVFGLLNFCFYTLSTGWDLSSLLP